MHPFWFPLQQIPVCKNHVQVDQEGEALFESWTCCSCRAEFQMDAMALVEWQQPFVKEQIMRRLIEFYANKWQILIHPSTIIWSKISTFFGGMLIRQKLWRCKHWALMLAMMTHCLGIWKMWGQSIMWPRHWLIYFLPKHSGKLPKIWRANSSQWMGINCNGRKIWSMRKYLINLIPSSLVSITKFPQSHSFNYITSSQSDALITDGVIISS